VKCILFNKNKFFDMAKVKVQDVEAPLAQEVVAKSSPQIITTSEQAVEWAKKWETARMQKVDADATLKACEENLKEWVDATGEMRFGKVMAYLRNSPPKIEGAVGSKLDELVDKLWDALPAEYREKKVLVSLLFKNVDDKAVKKALKTAGLTVVQQQGICFKHV
jgi:hypothetical protein